MTDTALICGVLAAICTYALLMKVIGHAYNKLLALALRYLEFLVFYNLTYGTLWHELRPYIYRIPEWAQDVYYKYSHTLSGFGFGTGGGTADLRPL